LKIGCAGGSANTKSPLAGTFEIAIKDGRPFTFAGLWENWKNTESREWQSVVRWVSR
jgi:putative SOS response-associated peptidase YedK